MRFAFLSLLVVVVGVHGQWNPHYAPGRNGIVHLFEWKWLDIAAECERWLAPRGFAGVQVSPVNENIIVGSRPWWERYQPISYKLTTRSGNEAEFLQMTTRCNAVGIRIYVDVLPNHMAAHQVPAIGTGGTTANTAIRNFPGVPFSDLDFNRPCDIYDWHNIYEVRNCQLVGLNDLDQSKAWVRDKIVEFFDHLVELGVAGFRVDAAKHMWPQDLEVIYNRVRNLNTAFGFPAGARPFITQEVIWHGETSGPSAWEYTPLGTVTEFRYGNDLGRAFRGQTELTWLQTFGEGWGLLPSHLALVFVDNHDTQRDHALTYKESRAYKMATGFGLAWPYGIIRMMSSFDFSARDQGPPADANENLISPSINPDNTCGNGWICEHRWRQIANMVGLSNVAAGTGVNNWWSNGANKIAFSRGNRAFVAFNNENNDFAEVLQTGMPEGAYCDIVTGAKVGSQCTGRIVTVGTNGVASIHIPANAEDGFLAIHADARL